MSRAVVASEAHSALAHATCSANVIDIQDMTMCLACLLRAHKEACKKHEQISGTGQRYQLRGQPCLLTGEDELPLHPPGGSLGPTSWRGRFSAARPDSLVSLYLPSRCQSHRTQHRLVPPAMQANKHEQRGGGHRAKKKLKSPSSTHACTLA
eukprot:805350-Pelagomonas_calceolata.AAC.3